jgi:hypothetical protein
MVLRCIHAFGRFVPGNEVEVPDGAVFDHAYFEVAPDVIQDAEQPVEHTEEVDNG